MLATGLAASGGAQDGARSGSGATRSRTAPKRSAALAVAAIAAALLAAPSFLGGAARAAPVTNVAGIETAAGRAVLPAHGFHYSCARDRYGWHRHNEWGERFPCRRWNGRGARPDFCVRVGPVWFCG